MDKKKLSENNKQEIDDKTRPSKHHYPVLLISFLVAVKVKTSCSFRAVSKYLCIMNAYYQMSIKVPSHVTISHWVKKVGYYQLSQPKEVANDWIIIIDESIQIGAEKLLLVLGVRTSKIDFSRALNFQDVLPILLMSKPGWNAQKIKEEVEKVKEILGTIIYAVSDKGASIYKGLELCGIPHIHDITHRTANILKKVYKNDNEFTEYLSRVSKLRLQIQQTKWAYLLPPQQRSQSRFLNLKPIMEWGINILGYLEGYQQGNVDLVEAKEIEEKFGWIIEKETLIREVKQILDVINKIFKLVKTQGICEGTVKECNQYLEKIQSIRGKIVKKEILNYLNEILSTVKGEKKILCTSDIIESTFGMYKNNISKNALNGITNLSLIIPAITNTLEPDEIKQIMEKVEIKKINYWSEENLGKSLSKKRKHAFKKKTGVKINLKKVA